MFCGYESFHSLVRRNPKFDLRPNAFIIRFHALLKFRRAISAEPSRECGAVQPCRRFPFRILVVRRTRIMHFHKFFTTIKINHFFGLTKPSQFLGNAVNQNSSRANGLNRIDTFFFKSDLWTLLETGPTKSKKQNMDLLFSYELQNHMFGFWMRGLYQK